MADPEFTAAIETITKAGRNDPATAARLLTLLRSDPGFSRLLSTATATATETAAETPAKKARISIFLLDNFAGEALTADGLPAFTLEPDTYIDVDNLTLAATDFPLLCDKVKEMLGGEGLGEDEDLRWYLERKGEWVLIKRGEEGDEFAKWVGEGKFFNVLAMLVEKGSGLGEENEGGKHNARGDDDAMPEETEEQPRKDKERGEQQGQDKEEERLEKDQRDGNDGEVEDQQSPSGSKRQHSVKRTKSTKKKQRTDGESKEDKLKKKWEERELLEFFEDISERTYTKPGQDKDTLFGITTADRVLTVASRIGTFEQLLHLREFLRHYRELSQTGWLDSSHLSDRTQLQAAVDNSRIAPLIDELSKSLKIVESVHSETSYFAIKYHIAVLDLLERRNIVVQAVSGKVKRNDDYARIMARMRGKGVSDVDIANKVVYTLLQKFRRMEGTEEGVNEERFEDVVELIEKGLSQPSSAFNYALAFGSKLEVLVEEFGRGITAVMFYDAHGSSGSLLSKSMLQNDLKKYAMSAVVDVLKAREGFAEMCTAAKIITDKIACSQLPAPLVLENTNRKVIREMEEDKFADLLRLQ